MPVRAIALSVALLLVGCSLSTDDATASASLRHSATEVQSCLELSAGRHAGAAFVSECYGPAGRFREDLEYTLNALTP